jgi:hypothetical protein
MGVKPALPAEQWADIFDPAEDPLFKPFAVWFYPDGDVTTEHNPLESPRHAAAALCLYKQPFGFTGEDLLGLREILRDRDPRPIALERIEATYAKIAALLPETESPS